MKENKTVYVAKHNIRDDQHFVYNYANIDYTDRYASSNFGCQYDSKKDNVLCTCKRISARKPDMRFFSGVPKQIYEYHGSRSFTDIGVGVGSLKALQRRKIKRVYLPEIDNRGVGSSDLSSYVIRSKEIKSCYYNDKKTSSKCVGVGIIEYNTGCVISEKLSPIVQTRSGSTSPKVSYDQKNMEIGSNTVFKHVVTIGTQFEMDGKKSEESEELKESKEFKDAKESKESKVSKESKTSKESKVSKESKEDTVKSDREIVMPTIVIEKVSEQTQKFKNSSEIQAKKRADKENKVKEAEKVYSSDSLVQHVHNLENPSDYKESRGSNQCIDPMENKLEREYRKMFTTKERDSKSSVDKTIPEFKSASILRRRFEALRRGMVKKEDGKKNVTPSSQDSVPSRKDASVTSDPPSLEGRSFTDTKVFNPIQPVRTERDSLQWPPYTGRTSDVDSECQGVKGMFKLWSKKFNFEEELEKTKSKHIPSLAIDINKPPHKEIKTNKINESKKSGRKFFFFKKKSKEQKDVEKPVEKEREPYVQTSGVTTGRCEIKDGLTLKVTGTPKATVPKKAEEKDDVQRATWLKKFLVNTIESVRSVNIRWNNSMYATSSSTVFELMDTIYKNNGVVLKSRSEITTDESSYFRTYNKNKVCFDRNIEAWMIPNTIPDKPKEIPVRMQSNKEMKDRKIECTISGHRWFIEKSKGFANKIEVVLHSNYNKIPKLSSEYLRIDIPKDLFDVSSSDDSKQHPTSDEMVYKVVEYESDINTKKATKKGDHAKVLVSVQNSKNIETEFLETVTKRPPMHRDVVIQVSNANIPKRCDVIGVGIITQRDMRVNRKPILKIQDDITDDDSEEDLHTNPKKCEFAESYLQEYYRHWIPYGMDLFSWCVSDSHLRSSSEKSLISFHNQGDGSKSCPNIVEEFQTSAIISSCTTSSCSQCCAQKEESLPCKFFKRFKKNGKEPSKAKTDTDIPGTRVMPKDSLEVFKRRKLYAASLKSQWARFEDKPVSVPSIASRGAQKTAPTLECPKLDKSCCKPPRAAKKKPCKKHVSMPDCDTMNDVLEDQLSEGPPQGILAYKGQAGCDACKKKGMKCLKHAMVKRKPVCVIPQPPCMVPHPCCDKMSLQDVQGSEPPYCNRPHKHCSRCCMPPSPSCQSPPPACSKRRNAVPNIKSSPPISPCMSNNSSPKASHNCMSPRSPSPQKKGPNMPCLKYPGRRPPSSSESSALCLPPRSPKCSPPQSPLSPPRTPCSPPRSLCSPPSSPPRSPCPPPKPPSSPPRSPCPPPKPPSSPPKPPCSPPRSPPRSPCPPPKLPSIPPKPSPPRSPPRSPCSTPPSPGMSLKNCGIGPKKPKPKKPKLCNVPPCSELKKKKKPSPSVSPCKVPKEPSPSCSETSQPKNKEKCKKSCSMLPASSSICSVVHSVERDTKHQSTVRSLSPECPTKKPSCPSPICRPKPERPIPMPCPVKPTERPPRKELCSPVCSPKPSCPPTPPPCSPRPASCPPSPPPCSPPPPNCPPSPKGCSSPPPLCSPSPKGCSSPPPLCSPSPPACPPKPECPATTPPESPRSQQLQCPASQQQLCPAKKPSCIETGKAKISGLFLKMKPTPKKTCTKECNAWDTQADTEVVRLRSREKIIISMKRETPSTQEIREGMNIKVQDDDGNTLYERRDYTCDQSVHRPSVLGDLYKDSKIHRVSTLKTNNDEDNKDPDITDYKSEQSLANLVEIEFKLRITNGDKTTEINIGNEDQNRQEKNNEISRSSPEVYLVDNETNKEPEAIEESNPKNDINIKIVVKNYKPLPDKHKNTKMSEEFSKKISSKFHTVSTGYSGNCCLNGENLFSVGMTAVEVRSSDDKSNIHSNELISEELNEPINFIVSSHSEHLASEVTVSEVKSMSSKKDTQSYDIYDYTNELDTKDLDTDQDALEINTSDECNEIKHTRSIYSSKRDKKELLKRVFEQAHTKPKNKENVRQLRDILKIILTDSSDNDDTNEACELAKDMTYASLRPDFLRDSDSMNNYYKIESLLAIDNGKVDDNIYTTKEYNSGTSFASNKIKPQGCMCSHVAQKLNDNLKTKFGCSCRQQTADGVTSCHLTNAQDLLSVLNYRAEYVDVHTQNSNLYPTPKKSNGTNVSKHNQENRVRNEKETVIEGKANNNESKDSNIIELTKIFHRKTHTKESERPKLYRNTVLGISDDDKIILLSEEAARKTAKIKQAKMFKKNIKLKHKLFKGADVLQSYETKKAVLEIYAQRTVTKNGEQYVAKLPKFVFERASEITRNYDEMAANSYKSVCRRNIIKMSVEG